MIHEFAKPIRVVVKGGQHGYALYTKDCGEFENDIWCVVLCDGGIVRHYRTDQLRVTANATLDICRDEDFVK